ncbi:hypothetical protein BDV97DRAFT_373985 [Delphinella strobiligena]|nr:hypothetical protein BDV97DRAFT_373985 [Delphinella strobiligena]
MASPLSSLAEEVAGIGPKTFQDSLARQNQHRRAQPPRQRRDRRKGCRELVKEIESREGYLDILANRPPTAKTPLYVEDTLESWTDVYATDIEGPYSSRVLSDPSFPSRQKYHGTIINISSNSGLARISQIHFSYNTAKGATVHLNKMLASDIASAASRSVNAIAPSVLPSETPLQLSDKNQKSGLRKEHGDIAFSAFR